MENQIFARQRAAANRQERQDMYLRRSQRWDDFRKRKAEVLGRYLEVKRIQKRM